MTLEVVHTSVRRDSRQVLVKRRCCCKRQRESQTTFCMRARSRAEVPTFNAVLAGLTLRMNLRDYTDEPVNHGHTVPFISLDCFITIENEGDDVVIRHS